MRGKNAEKRIHNLIVKDLRKDFHIGEYLPYFRQYLREVLE